MSCRSRRGWRNRLESLGGPLDTFGQQIAQNLPGNLLSHNGACLADGRATVEQLFKFVGYHSGLAIITTVASDLPYPI